MENKRRDLEDIACELTGIAALADVLSGDFLENGNRWSDHVIGNALFAVSRYAERISDDLTALAAEEETV